MFSVGTEFVNSNTYPIQTKLESNPWICSFKDHANFSSSPWC